LDQKGGEEEKGRNAFRANLEKGGGRGEAHREKEGGKRRKEGAPSRRQKQWRRGGGDAVSPYPTSSPIKGERGEKGK